MTSPRRDPPIIQCEKCVAVARIRAEKVLRELWFADLLVQPGPRQRPEPVGRSPADAESLRGLLMREPAKVAQLHQLGGLSIVPFQFVRGFIQRQQLVGAILRSYRHLTEVNPPCL